MNTNTPTLPQLCGDIDIRIARDGTWFHDGTPIGRKELVKLFASVLMRDDVGDYWLKTPVEQARIRVDDAPFMGVEITVAGEGRARCISLRTNIDETVPVDGDHPLRVSLDPESGEPGPYVTVRNGLDAKLTRSVYYEIMNLGSEETIEGSPLFGIWSHGCFFPLDGTGTLPGTTASC